MIKLIILKLKQLMKKKGKQKWNVKSNKIK